MSAKKGAAQQRHHLSKMEIVDKQGKKESVVFGNLNFSMQQTVAVCCNRCKKLVPIKIENTVNLFHRLKHHYAVNIRNASSYSHRHLQSGFRFQSDERRKGSLSCHHVTLEVLPAWRLFRSTPQHIFGDCLDLSIYPANVYFVY